MRVRESKERVVKKILEKDTGVAAANLPAARRILQCQPGRSVGAIRYKCEIRVISTSIRQERAGTEGLPPPPPPPPPAE